MTSIKWNRSILHYLLTINMCFVVWMFRLSLHFPSVVQVSVPLHWQIDTHMNDESLREGGWCVDRWSGIYIYMYTHKKWLHMIYVQCDFHRIIEWLCAIESLECECKLMPIDYLVLHMTILNSYNSWARIWTCPSWADWSYMVLCRFVSLVEWDDGCNVPMALMFARKQSTKTEYVACWSKWCRSWWTSDTIATGDNYYQQTLLLNCWRLLAFFIKVVLWVLSSLR